MILGYLENFFANVSTIQELASAETWPSIHPLLFGQICKRSEVFPSKTEASFLKVLMCFEAKVAGVADSNWHWKSLARKRCRQNNMTRELQKRLLDLGTLNLLPSAVVRLAAGSMTVRCQPQTRKSQNQKCCKPPKTANNINEQTEIAFKMLHKTKTLPAFQQKLTFFFGTCALVGIGCRRSRSFR